MPYIYSKINPKFQSYLLNHYNHYKKNNSPPLNLSSIINNLSPKISIKPISSLNIYALIPLNFHYPILKHKNLSNLNNTPPSYSNI